MFMGSNSYFFPTKLFMSKRFRTTKVLHTFLDLNPSFNPQGEVGGYKKNCEWLLCLCQTPSDRGVETFTQLVTKILSPRIFQVGSLMPSILVLLRESAYCSLSIFYV